MCVCVSLWGQVMRQLTAKAPLFVEKTIWSHNNAVEIRFKMIKLNVDFPIFASQHKTWHFNALKGAKGGLQYWLDTKIRGAPIIRLCAYVCVTQISRSIAKKVKAENKRFLHKTKVGISSEYYSILKGTLNRALCFCLVEYWINIYTYIYIPDRQT